MPVTSPRATPIKYPMNIRRRVWAALVRSMDRSVHAAFMMLLTQGTKGWVRMLVFSVR